MKATWERNPGSQVALEIEVEPGEVEAELDPAARRLARSLRIPGFRPGKAPPAVVQRLLGRPRVLQEALDPVVQHAYQQALDEQGLVAVGQADIEVTEFTDGQPLRFVAKVAVRPEVKLGDYRAIRVSQEAAEVAPGDIDAALEDMRNRNATWVPTEDPAADGDLVILRSEGGIVGGPKADKRKTEGVIGEGRLRPEIEAGVRGKAAGSEIDVELTFAADDADRRLAGRSGHLHVHLLEVKHREVPALDDAFAATVSDFQTLEELRADLGNRLRDAAVRRAEAEGIQAAVREAVAQAEVELPEVWIARATDNLIRNLQARLAASGIAWGVYLKQTGQTLEDLRADLRADAETNVRTELVLGAIAADAELEPSAEEIDEEIARQVASPQGPAPQVMQLPENRALIASSLAQAAARRLLGELAVTPAAEAGAAAAPGAEAQEGTVEP